MYTEVIFDIETQKLFDQIDDPKNLPDLKVSVVSAYKRRLDGNLREVGGEMASFWPPFAEGFGGASISEDQLKKMGGFIDMSLLWQWLAGADIVIAFNTLRFDAPVLKPYLPGDVMRLPHFDILEKVKAVIGHRLSLDALAKETLGENKLANGLAAVDWWNAGDEESLDNLQKYCEMDVMVTKKLYDVGLRGEKLKYVSKWNEPKEFEVDFSYPKKEEEFQLGLF